MPKVKYGDWKQLVDKDVIATVGGVRHVGTVIGVNPYRSVACGAPPWMLATPDGSVYFDPGTESVDIEVIDLAPNTTSQSYDREDVERWAREAGLLREGMRINEAHITFALMVAARCAAAGDRYDSGESNAGEDIRAMFGLR
jgi:hypothetical protein